MRAMKALLANYFLDPLLQTFPMAYYTCPGHKNFTFQLPGKCDIMNDTSPPLLPWTGQCSYNWRMLIDYLCCAAFLKNSK